MELCIFVCVCVFVCPCVSACVRPLSTSPAGPISRCTWPRSASSRLAGRVSVVAASLFSFLFMFWFLWWWCCCFCSCRCCWHCRCFCYLLSWAGHCWTCAPCAGASAGQNHFYSILFSKLWLLQEIAGHFAGQVAEHHVPAQVEDTTSFCQNPVFSSCSSRRRLLDTLQQSTTCRRKLRTYRFFVSQPYCFPSCGSRRRLLDMLQGKWQSATCRRKLRT